MAGPSAKRDEGLRLVRATDELVSNGLATREFAEIGRVLVYCQWCNRFTSSGCCTFDGRSDRPDLLDMLTDRGRWCPYWPDLIATPYDRANRAATSDSQPQIPRPIATPVERPVTRLLPRVWRTQQSEK